MVLVAAAYASGQSNADAAATEAYLRLFAKVDSQRLASDMAAISRVSSRIAGSKGERQALGYVEAEFRRLGLQRIRHEPFSVTIPDPDARGVLSDPSGSWNAEVFPLWPNLVRTSTCDVSGPLVYGRFGTLDDFAGKTIEGSIVLMEFASRGNWRNAFKLGAKAVVFLEPDDVERTDAEQKFSSAPLDAPRFYLPLSRAGPVLKAAFAGRVVQLRCRQDWVVRQTYNLLADLPGTASDSTSERITLAAPIDSMSVVPGLAPGASGASSVAALLELARLAAADAGRRPMTFAAVSANALGLQGWREYVERRVQAEMPTFLTLTLDLNDGGAGLGAFGRGWYVDYRNETLDPIRELSRVLRSHADRIAPLHGVAGGRYVLLDATNDSDGRHWKNTIYAKYAMACEPMIQANINGLTFATVENAREKIDTPFDTFENLRMQPILRQVKTLACLIWHLSRDTSDRDELSVHKVPLDLTLPLRNTLVGGFSTVEGQVVRFDPNESFIADIPVRDALAVISHSEKTLSGVRGALVQHVFGDNAKYRFLGLAPSSSFFHLDQRLTAISAYAMDPVSGRITTAPTDGLLGHSYDRFFRLTTSYRSMPVVVFECVATNLYDLTDPQELTPLMFFDVLDPKADSHPRNYSIHIPALEAKLNSEQEDCAVLFSEPGARFKLLMTTGFGEWRLILSNATAGKPGGEGYVASREEPVFLDLPLKTANDIVTLNDSRLKTFASYRILSPGLDELQEKARSALKDAEASKAAKDWRAFDRSSRAAWGYALRAHPMIRGSVNDVVNGVLFYLILLIPFSYFAERLFFARRSLSMQLVVAIGIFIIAFVLLRAIHPAFQIVSNPTMIFVAFVMGVLSLLVATFIVGKFEASLREMRALRTGMGHIDVGRMSVAMAAFNLGIANMRRRKARTFLTTLTLVVMTFIVLSFTSLVPGLSIAEAASNHSPTYPGLLVRRPGLEPMQNVTYRAVLNEFRNEATVVRRSWYYGAQMAEGGVLTISGADRAADVRALVGLEPGEQDVTQPQSALLPGGRWLRDRDFGVILLPFSVADQLRIGSEDVGKAQVQFGGRKLTVVGLLDDSRLRGTPDLDGESILPADFTLSTKFQTETRSTSQAFRKYLRLDPGTVAIVPLRFAMSLGGEIRSVAVRFRKESATREALKQLMPRLRMNLYAAVPGASGLEVKQFSVLQASKSAGLGLVLVQMLISAVFVLNTMVASVYERKREIGIFSSIGLAPNHIGVLFFAESCVYGVLGAVMGYFLAQGVSRAIIETGSAPGLFLNFSAGSAVLAAGIVLAIVLLSTIYPAKIAERLAAPAYESEIESVPEGDTWKITLPFRVGVAEAAPLMEFFAEWLRGHEEHTVGEFVTADTSHSGLELASTVWLSPFDLGVSQQVKIVATPASVGDVAELELILQRLSGEPENWVNVNKRFLTSIRRQFLAWRTKPGR